MELSQHYNEVYYNNELQVKDATIRDWDVNMGLSEGRYMNIAQGFAYSSNVGMTRSGAKDGKCCLDGLPNPL